MRTIRARQVVAKAAASRVRSAPAGTARPGRLGRTSTRRSVIRTVASRAGTAVAETIAAAWDASAPARKVTTGGTWTSTPPSGAGVAARAAAAARRAVAGASKASPTAWGMTVNVRP